MVYLLPTSSFSAHNITPLHPLCAAMAIPTPTSVLTRLAVCEEAPDRCAIISDPPPYEVSQALQNAFNANTCGPSCRPQEDLNDSDNDLPPYDPVVPPYFPKTPIAPFLACIVRRPGWENGDLSLFMRDADTWAQDFDVLRAELRSWDLPEDPNAYVRTQLRDPAGWSGISENDVRWADSSFPPGIRSEFRIAHSCVNIALMLLCLDTVLSLRPNAQMSLFYNTEASSELMGTSFTLFASIMQVFKRNGQRRSASLLASESTASLCHTGQFGITYPRQRPDVCLAMTRAGYSPHWDQISRMRLGTSSFRSSTTRSSSKRSSSFSAVASS